jgi:cytosine/adenosine deaminase-related metal-dependent hydrolase
MVRKNPHAVILGRKGGKVGGKSTSPAKAAAARLNGLKGGAPKKGKTADAVATPFDKGKADPSREEEKQLASQEPDKKTTR